MRETLLRRCERGIGQVCSDRRFLTTFFGISLTGVSNMLTRKTTVLTLVLLGMTYASVSADDNASVIRTARKRDSISLDAGPSTSLQRPPTAQELIQARAWNRHLQREARMQANAWYGYEPLRPTLSADPYTRMHYHIYRPRTIWSVYDYSTFPW